MGLWRAGEIKKENVLGKEGLGVKGTSNIGQVSLVLEEGFWGYLAWRTGPMMVVALLALQALSMGVQGEREWASSDSISKMKSEQRWLIGQGLADERRIGVVSRAAYGHLTNNVNPRASSQGQESIGGWDMILPVSTLARVAAKLASRSDPGDQPRAISAPRDAESRSGFDPELKASYRHEEGHSRAGDKQLRAGSPQAWPSLVGKVVAEALGAGNGFPAREGASALAKESAENNWRLRWMLETRSEAFADAYSVLTSARKGKGELGKTALATHASRIIDLRAEVVTSLDCAGAIHSVEMASFIAGQLDESKVAALGSLGVDELAGKIADDALAWAVARQGPKLGFFKPEGAAWWSRMAKKAGVEEAQADEAWRNWEKGATAELPKAAFGEFAYDIQGAKMRAMGLSAEVLGLPTYFMTQTGDKRKEEKVKANWRYDGEENMLAEKEYMEPSVARQGEWMLVSEGRMFAKDGSVMLRRPEKVGDESLNRWKGAVMGAVSQQMLLAHRLGVNMEEHVELLKKNGGATKMFSSMGEFYADYFKCGGAKEDKQAKRAPRRGGP